jgi:RHS repeat-associated protein
MRSDASRAENAKDDLALSDSAERSIAVLLGIRTAQAAPAASAAGKALPGALGLPRDPQAVLDQRYLWDTQGNLLHSENQLPTPTQKNYAYDWRDRLIALVSASGERQHASRYYYDTGSRRVLSQEQIDDQSDTLSHTQQTAYQPDTHRWIKSGELQAQYDANGQPQTIGQREYVWDALGRLIAVRQADKSIASYTYNHRGERIGKQTGGTTSAYLYEDRQLLGELNAQGRLTRQYIELGGQPFAVIDTPDGQELATTPATGLSRIAHDLRTLADIWFGDREQLVWLHNNHLGATEAATNAKGELIWRADYAAFGQATIRSRGFTLNLRLPGQYEDSETGLYYNRQRYYSPSLGQYISPDPAGNPDGPNGYSYVRNNPLKYIDPDGLILFAFDGTGNSDDMSDPAMQGNGYSNVVKFRDLYKSGEAQYVTGVGTVHHDTKYGDIVPDVYAKGTPIALATPGTPLFYNDMGGNYSGPARIDRMVQYFKDEAEATGPDKVMDVDITGFSRGAAEARDFANRIAAATTKGTDGKLWYSYKDSQGKAACQQVNFRFMGLFDTVLSTNGSGVNYQLGIPDSFQYVAQAVALNEYRSGNPLHWMARNPKPYKNHWGGFPLESIGASSDQPGKTRIEMGFLGAHADIGGGYPDAESGLSSVALTWMVNQAKLAGVTMRDTSIDMNNPVIHDQSDAMRVGDPTKTNVDRYDNPIVVEDREVHGATKGSTQRSMQFNNDSMTNADTHQYIHYTPREVNPTLIGSAQDYSKMGNITGTVDMAGYMKWLNDHGYFKSKP